MQIRDSNAQNDFNSIFNLYQNIAVNNPGTINQEPS